MLQLLANSVDKDVQNKHVPRMTFDIFLTYSPKTMNGEILREEYYKSIHFFDEDVISEY